MLRLICLILFTGLLGGVHARPLDVSVQAESAILINADTGAVLFEKNSRRLQFPASITKIATAAYALKVRGDKLDKTIEAEHDSIASVSDEEMKRSAYTLPPYWLTPGTSHMGIKKGEILSLKDLLYGLMVASAGDAANVIAQYIGGTVPVFMTQLNAYLQEIGCAYTKFKNPHGLHHPEHQTTAYDMAILAREAMKNPTFCEIVKTIRYGRPQTNKQKPTDLFQTNRLLKKGPLYYSKAIGVKTGYTALAQNNLVAAVRDGDRTLIVVLMKCDDREAIFRDAKLLCETAFQEKKVHRKYFSAGPQTFELKIKGAAKSIKTILPEDAVLAYYPAEEPTVKCMLKWDAVELPAAKGQRVGELAFQDAQGKTLFSKALVAADDVGYSIGHKIKSFVKAHIAWTLAAACALFLAVFLFFRLAVR